MLFGIVHAQQNTILYTDIAPDYSFKFSENNQTVFHTDMDDDGIEDFYFFSLREHGFYPTFDIVFQIKNGIGGNARTSICQFGDTLTQLEYLTAGETFFFWDTIPKIKYVAIRFNKDDGHYYGWLELSVIWEGTMPDFFPSLTVKRMAYCTIPDYPLKAGQIDFTWGMTKNKAPAFAFAQPNPTNGTVKIFGENLHQADVFNVLGQQVTTVKGDGESLRIDLNAQPAGIYFINVTDKEGRKCVRKVVKNY